MGVRERVGALTLIGLIGLALLVVGIAQVYPPGAFIASGLVLLAVSIAGARPYLAGGIR